MDVALLYILIFAVIAFILVMLAKRNQENWTLYEHKIKYKRLYVGMSEWDMIETMDWQYNMSKYSGDKSKYIFKYNQYSVTYEKVEKCTVKYQDGKVISIEPHNLP